MGRKPGLERQLRALADTSRLRIVNLLLHKEMCGAEIAMALGLSQPNISRHLNYLKHTGLVGSRRRGFRVYYRLKRQDRLVSGLLDLLRIVFGRDPVFLRDLRRLQKIMPKGNYSSSSAPATKGNSEGGRKLQAD